MKKLFSPKARLLLFILFLCVLAGCVSKEPEKRVEAPVFYPPPPDLPRFQFLTAFRGTTDFDKDNEISALDSFLGASRKGYTLKKPYGVATVKGAMYVVDTQSSVWKFDFVNKRVNKIAGDKGLGKLVQPINVSIDEKGNKYVADPIRNAVIMYDRNDFFVRSFLSPEPWKPVDTEVYEGMLYVVDATHRIGGIKVFDLKSGEIVDTLGQKGPPEQRLLIPSNISFDNDGFLFVMDTGRFQVVKYDRDGHYRGYLGNPGDSPGFFGRPRGVDIDKDGRIYTVDASFDVVQIFSENGQVLAILGGPGTIPGTLTLPAAVCVDYDNIDFFQEYAAPGFEIEYLVFVTSQFHNTNAVSVYAYGKMSGKKYPSDEELKRELEQKLKELK